MRIPDMEIIHNHNFMIANTASQFATINEEIERSLDAVREINAERHAAILRTADFSEKQKELLEKQLEEVKQQNSQLKENYKLLNELYESAKREALESAKEARHNKIFGWVSFGVGTLIGIAGIVFGIIF